MLETIRHTSPPKAQASVAPLPIYVYHVRLANSTKRVLIMRSDIHPEYQEVLFHDTNADQYFVIRSTATPSATREHEGKEYPYIPLDISSASHPFYTGEQRQTANEGRVATFNKRFGGFNRGKK